MRSATVRLPGHPDHACDLVAEAIVDEYLKRDSETRIRVAVSGGRGALFVSGDVKSMADFDVSGVVNRALGSLGVMAGMEPFISLEPVAPEQANVFQQGIGVPAHVHGYATSETSELVPAPLALARRIAKALDDRRQSDEDWFWLGPDAEVTVLAEQASPLRAVIEIEHGPKDLNDARSLVGGLVRGIALQLDVKVNDRGPNEMRGIGNMMGASGRTAAPYGSGLPASPPSIGLDPRHPQKAGAWLCRAAARKLVASGANAALVQAVYVPGEDLPYRLVARDERGKDLSQALTRENFSLNRVMAEWWRQGLNTDACRWGFAGEAGLPWEA